MATVKDIALRSGVSTATVSYVLNDGPRAVLPATRERVRKAIEELDYHPNPHARSLRGKRTNALGVVFPHRVAQPFENGYFGPILAGIMDVSTGRKMATMLFTGFEWEEAEFNASLLCDGRCDGLLIVAPPRRGNLIQDVIRRKTRLVVIGTHVENVEVDSVDVNNVIGARLAVQHLIGLGHRRIAIALGADRSTSSSERLEGYRQMMGEFELGYLDEWLIPETGAGGRGQDHYVWELLADPEKRPTAIFCVQDGKAISVCQIAQQMGLRVPQDLSVVGFDDIYGAIATSPQLTTIRQPMRQIGTRAAELLCQRIEAPGEAIETFLFDPHLIIRGSTGPP
jgi:DNA-binding LacI/PurR family transcriptional regulator